MAYQHLNTSERKAIYYRHSSGESARSIAKLIGRHHTTVLREIKRNKPRYYTYFDEGAVVKAAQRRSIARHKRKRSNPKLHSYVINKLKRSWSPEVISGRLLSDYPNDYSMRISHEGIYKWIYKDFKDGGGLYKLLAKTHKTKKDIYGHPLSVN